MPDNGKYIDCCITPEKIASISERGMNAVHLSLEEKEYLLNQGLDELYAAWDFEKEEIPCLDAKTVSLLMKQFAPSQTHNQIPDLWIKLGHHAIETLQHSFDWMPGSAAFAFRETNTSTISFHRKVGKLTIHMEIVRRDERLADINVKVTDNSETKTHAFDAELLKGDQCVETIHTTKDTTASFYAVEIADYILRISDAKNEIASIALRMQT